MTEDEYYPVFEQLQAWTEGYISGYDYAGGSQEYRDSGIPTKELLRLQAHHLFMNNEDWRSAPYSIISTRIAIYVQGIWEIYYPGKED